MISELDRLLVLLKSSFGFFLVFNVHFPDFDGSHVPVCRECVDFQMGFCPGNSDPVSCILEQSRGVKSFLKDVGFSAYV
jgi:hypothetical protein